MELVYSWVFFIGIPIILILIFLKLKRPTEYKDGKKIANTKYAMSIPYYKEIMKKYKLLTNLIKFLCIVCILVSLVLIARPVKIENNKNKLYNRDIFLCMDVSGSMFDVNKELCETLKETVKNLKGERFGISIFNETSVLVVPLTDDYDFILNSLDTLEKGFDLYGENYSSYESDSSGEHSYLWDYIYSGTWNAGGRGASLIGDGLASCVYDFTDMEEDRTRIIILSTDNGLNGDPIVTLDEAVELCAKNKITVFGVSPDNTLNPEELKSALEKTGGNSYKMDDDTTVQDIVDNIEKQEKSMIEVKSEVKMLDQPEIPFIILIVSVFILFILNKRVKL